MFSEISGPEKRESIGARPLPLEPTMIDPAYTEATILPCESGPADLPKDSHAEAIVPQWSEAAGDSQDNPDKQKITGAERSARITQLVTEYSGQRRQPRIRQGFADASKEHPDRFQQIQEGLDAYAAIPEGGTPTEVQREKLETLVDARQELVLANRGLAVKLANRYYRDGKGVTRDDAIQAAHEGLCEAVNRFDPGKGFQFSTFAGPWIHKRVNEAFEHPLVGATGHAYNDARKIDGKAEELRVSLGHEPSNEEIAASFNDRSLGLKRITALREQGSPPLASLDKPIDESGTTLGTLVADVHDPTASLASRMDTQAIFSGPDLTDREKLALALRSGAWELLPESISHDTHTHNRVPGTEMSFAELGKVFGMTGAGARKIWAQAAQKARELLAEK